MGERIGRIYKYDQRNWPYPSPNTTFFIPQHSDQVNYGITSVYIPEVSLLPRVRDQRCDGTMRVHDKFGP